MPTPPTTGMHHFSPTVSDVEASASWYERIFGMERIPAPFPHHGSEDSGHAVVLTHDSGMIIGLHHHDANQGDRADESRTGLDHMAFGVADRDDLEAWTSWLDECGVAHSGVVDETNPVPYSVVVFRDPDNIQLELMYMGG